MSDRDKIKQRRDDLSRRMREQVAKSITRRNSKVTISDPERAAQFVVNAFTVHETRLLAELAVEYAPLALGELLRDLAAEVSP